MLGNIFLKTLRDHRWGLLIWGLGLGTLVAIVVVEYQQFFANNEQQAQFMDAYKAFGFLVGEYVPINTLGGFMTIETMVYGSLILGLWAAFTGVAMTRGEEEPGALDVLMSTQQSRMQVFWQKVAALAVEIVAASSLVGLMLYLGLLVSGQTLPVEGVLGTLLNIAVAASMWGAAGVLVGQLVTRRRVASVLVGTLIFGTYLFNTVTETSPSLKDLSWATPFHYYNMSKPLVAGKSLDVWGILVLLGSAAVLIILAAWFFARRDIGGAPALALGTPRVHRSRRRESSALLQSVFAKNMRDLLVPTLLWGVGLGAYCAMIVATATEALAPMYDAMNSIPWFTRLFGRLLSNEAYLSVGVFLYLPLVLVAFALTQVAGWAGDEEEGRMEVLVSEPVPRWQVALSRYVAATISLAAILALIIVGLLATAALMDVKLDGWRVTGAVLASAPLVLVSMAFGLVLATWMPRPGMAVGITGGLVVLMFFVSTLAPLFDWPDIVQNLSIFHLYGKPVTEGIAWADMWVLLGATLLLAAFSLVGFQRRDIAK